MNYTQTELLYAHICIFEYKEVDSQAVAIELSFTSWDTSTGDKQSCRQLGVSRLYIQ